MVSSRLIVKLSIEHNKLCKTSNKLLTALSTYVNMEYDADFFLSNVKCQMKCIDFSKHLVGMKIPQDTPHIVKTH